MSRPVGIGRRASAGRRAGVTLAILATVSLVAAACSSSPRGSGGPGGSSGGGKAVVTATDTSCPSASSCFVVGNVSTLGGPIPGLFEGALVGTNAYLTYVNSTGGVDGKKFRLLSENDSFSCAQNRSDVAALVHQVIAFAGSFSLFDNCGGQVLKANPEVPDVSVTLSNSTNALANNFSANPLVPGWQAGPLLWFQKHYPEAVKHVGTLVADAASSISQWNGQESAMKQEGYHISYETTFGPLDTNFTSEVIAMEQAGVQAVDLSDMNGATAARIVAAMFQQGFHPPLVFSAGPIYSENFVAEAGGPPAADGIYLEQPEALYLGTDAKVVPAVATFLHWVHTVSPGFSPDLYTVYGWASAELLVTALAKAGPDVTQASLMKALRSIDSFDAGGLMAPSDPAQKQPPTCWLLARIVNGQFVRYHMPTTGFRCGTGYLRQQPGGS